MKRQLFCSLAVLLIALCAVSANAQSITHTMKGNVPFNFYVADKVLPQGEYTVSTVGTAGMVVIAGPHGSTFLFTHGALSSAEKNANELVFHRVNNEYFLVSIWAAGDLLGYELPRSRHEKELVAQAGKPAETVLLASAR